MPKAISSKNQKSLKGRAKVAKSTKAANKATARAANGKAHSTFGAQSAKMKTHHAEGAHEHRTESSFWRSGSESKAQLVDLISKGKTYFQSQFPKATDFVDKWTQQISDLPEQIKKADFDHLPIKNEKLREKLKSTYMKARKVKEKIQEKSFPKTWVELKETSREIYSDLKNSEKGI